MATPPVDGTNSPESDASGGTAQSPGSAGTTELANELSDQELIESVRQGSTDAYARLYERHVNAAYSMARQVAKSHGEADDLVSEAFVRVLDTMRAGNGPNTAFRAYLLTSLRNTAYDRSRRERKIQLSEDVDELGTTELSLPFTDPALAGLERSLVATAFSRLPERWQAVLWHVEIEEEPPGEAAPVFGLTANGVSALAYRAREGLRQEYLQAHLGQLRGDLVERCRATVDRLGAWARGGLSKRENAQVETHLDGCRRCRELAAELADINGGLRVVIAPAVLGLGAMGYLTGGTVLGATAGAAGGAGASSGAHAASSVPRQTVGTAASGTALAATVALAIALTGNEQPPVASPPPPPAPVEQAPPAPESPVEAPVPKPAPAPAPPPPGVPNLTAAGPEHPVELVAGGSPSELPISVRNEGEGPSQPVTVTLSLPQGVTAEVPGVSSGGTRAAEPPAGQSAAAQPRSATTTPASTQPASTQPASTQPASTQPASTQPSSATATNDPSAGRSPQGTNCESFAGGIRCSSAGGLAPGESHTFPFRLHADETAQNGEVSVHVLAGQRIDFAMAAVPVVVRPPEPATGIRIEASVGEHFPWPYSRLQLEVRNTGPVSGRAQAVVKLPIGVHAFGIPPECETLPERDRELHCSAMLEPGQEFGGAVWLKASPSRALADGDADAGQPPSRTVTIPVVAMLGSAVDDDAVELRQVGIPGWPPPWLAPRLPEQSRDDQAPARAPAPTGSPSEDAPDPEDDQPSEPSSDAPAEEGPSKAPDPREEDGSREEGGPREEADPDEKVEHVTPNDARRCLSDVAELPVERRAAHLLTGCHAEG